MKEFNINTATPNEILEKIRQRRYQILVHSLIYYELDINIIDDNTWSKWGRELADLQKKYPEIAKQVTFAKEFEGFDGSTGCDLPYRDEQIVNIARKLLLIHGYKDKAEELKYVERTPSIYKNNK